MCGIVGVAGNVTIARDRLIEMRDALRHRGPDDAGVWWSGDGRVGLGHRRLAVIDLTAAGRQPMSDGSGTLQVVFNGEIYNYRELRSELQQLGHAFRTATDTEIILEAYRAWGDGCLSRLNGMFAFALYDAGARRLLLARDPAGEKPLFYRHHAGMLAFASEIKALVTDPSCPRALDVEALNSYLAFGYVPGERCLLDGVRKLLPGHALSFDVTSGRMGTHAFWTLPGPTTTDVEPSDHELLAELDRLLADSVRLRLVADVPVGVMLSGGVDSSLVAAMAARVGSRPIKTFTITFPGHGAFDETRHARNVARHLGTEHVELAAEPASIALLPELARQFDEPIADPSIVPTLLLSRLIRREATVALGGDGADELFGGYFQHSWVQQQARLSRWLPGSIRRLTTSAVSRLVPIGTRGRNYLLGLTAGPPFNIVQFNVVFDPGARRRLLAPLGVVGPGDLDRPESHKAAVIADQSTPLQQATALDFRTYLVDDILAKVDRASMLCSLEVRSPFLDPRLVDFAFRTLPDRLRATTRQRKILLRQLAARLLPPDFDLTRKQGFVPPLASWFRSDWGPFIEDVLTSADADLFDRRTVSQLLATERAGFSNSHRLFALTMIELWRREYRVTTVRDRRDATPLSQPA